MTAEQKLKKALMTACDEALKSGVPLESIFGALSVQLHIVEVSFDWTLVDIIKKEHKQQEGEK